MEPEHTGSKVAYPRSPRIWVQYGYLKDQHAEQRLKTLLRHSLTPASTLVISNTRMPANGSVGKGSVDVARQR